MHPGKAAAENRLFQDLARRLPRPPDLRPQTLRPQTLRPQTLRPQTLRHLPALLLLLLCGLPVACGGGSVPPGAPGAGDLILLTFHQDGLDGVAPNSELAFEFDAPIDPDSVDGMTLSIRANAGLGVQARGSFAVDGARVVFRPDLAGRCDLSDGGLLPSADYAVVLVGAPADPAIRDTAGRALRETRTLVIRTGGSVDPALQPDPTPGSFVVTAATPAGGSAAVGVAGGNQVVLTLDANVRPCSIAPASVRVRIFQRGHIGTFVAAGGGSGNPSGFATASGDTSDQAPGDPYSWGGAVALPDVTTLPVPQTVPVDVRLTQTPGEARLTISPADGAPFPENALLVLELTSAIESFGGVPLMPFTMAFTTENLPARQFEYVLENEGETPYDAAATSADVDTARAPSRVQGFLVFAGDGDNGVDLLGPSLPQSDAGCSTDYQSDDGSPDHFDPGADVLLDTGSSENGCPNDVDGSQAVVWQFASLRIRDGITVRIVGRNPAILLVRGDARIDPGGRLLARGDGQGGAPVGEGEGDVNATTRAGTAGGEGVAGGGDGGSSPEGFGTDIPPRLGGHGLQGYRHLVSDGSLAPDVGAAGGLGSGHGNTSARWNEQTNPNNRNTPSGGGGGHATSGEAGTALGAGDLPTSLDDAPDGAGGGSYGYARLELPSAGSGGGAGGELRPFSGNIGRGPGGAGGAGGGFIDITAGGDLTVLGTIDVSGSDGGSNPGGLFNPNYGWNPGTGGGGGGSGGGVRLITPGELVFAGSTVITAAGGKGGAGGLSHGVGPAANDGGDGGAGRIVLEDGNSIVTGLSSASVTPAEGSTGFYRGTFDGARFRSGERTPQALTGVFSVGSYDPEFLEPVQDDAGVQDFEAGVPAASGIPLGRTALLVEARGYPVAPDGTADLLGAVAPPTDWHTVGYFTAAAADGAPAWNAGQPPAAEIGGSLPDGNLGVAGLANLDGCEFVQLRFTFYLDASADAADPGPWLDRWVIRTTSDH